MASSKRLHCPKCKEDWQYGWESAIALLVFLKGRVTTRGRDGQEYFDWVKCSKCDGRFKLSSLGL